MEKITVPSILIFTFGIADNTKKVYEMGGICDFNLLVSYL
jgi:hypothetical protein